MPRPSRCSTRARLNLLLDTHVLLWTLSDPGRIPDACRRSIEDPENDVWVSAISIWEIAIKIQSGKLQVEQDLERAVQSQGMQMLSFTSSHATAISRLALHHRDPFDRALIAQCLEDKLSLVSADRA